jgi:hypothetical protein
MLRLLLTFGFACFLALVGVAGTPVAELCEQTCPDDDAEGRCASDCADCACCSHAPHSVPLSAPPRTLWVALKQLDVEWNGRALPIVEPQEILHVPIVPRA